MNQYLLSIYQPDGPVPPPHAKSKMRRAGIPYRVPYEADLSVRTAHWSGWSTRTALGGTPP
jgi:hypothetical protein